MKKVIMFFVGFLLLISVFAILYFASLLFNAANNSSVNSFVFQPNNLSVNRIGPPIPAENIPKRVQEKLIKKFVFEYFYIYPDVEDFALRVRKDSVLSGLSNSNVFKQWKDNQSQQMEQMTNDKMLRTVIINNNGILKKEGSDYFEVHYELKTWTKPNIMGMKPEITTGVINLKTLFENGLREKRGGINFNINDYIKRGGNPAALFKFTVTDVKM